MTPFQCPAKPHFLVHQDDEIALNPVAFSIHYGPHKDHKKIWSLPDYKSTHLRICLPGKYGTSSRRCHPDDIHHHLINLPQIYFFLESGINFVSTSAKLVLALSHATLITPVVHISLTRW